jgi:excisionase family DNA binding protein
MFVPILQVAARLGVSRATVCVLIRKGKLPATRPGGRNYRVLETDLLEFIASLKSNVKGR